MNNEIEAFREFLLSSGSTELEKFIRASLAMEDDLEKKVRELVEEEE